MGTEPLVVGKFDYLGWLILYIAKRTTTTPASTSMGVPSQIGIDCPWNPREWEYILLAPRRQWSSD